MAAKTKDRETEPTVEKTGTTLFLPLVPEHLPIHFCKPTTSDNGLSSVLSRKESIVKPFVRDTIGETTRITNQDDTVVKGIIDIVGDIGTLRLQI